MKILFTGCTFSPSQIDYLKTLGYEVTAAPLSYSQEEFNTALKSHDLYIAGGDELANKEILESNAHLKLILFMGVGYEKYIDIKTAKALKIPVSFTPGANSYAVAEYAFGLLLAAAKNIVSSSETTKQGNWIKYKSNVLKNVSFGILGMGAVGTKMARLMKNAFNVELFYTSREGKPHVERELDAKKVDLETLFEKCDVISIHANLTPETTNLVDAKILNKAKGGLILINSSRAEIIEPKALLKAIKDNKLGIVAFDNYYDEPVQKEDKWGFLSLPNDKFIITPHTAYNADDSLNQMNKMLIESLEDFAQNNKIRHLVELK